MLIMLHLAMFRGYVKMSMSDKKLIYLVIAMLIMLHLAMFRGYVKMSMSDKKLISLV